jgi:hypothetical protein
MTPEQIKALRDDAKLLLNTTEGQQVLEDLKLRYGFYVPTFSADSHESAYREGQRSVVLFLMSLLRDEPKREEQDV